VQAKLDAFSSAIAFTGWAHGERFTPPANYDPLPVTRPRTSLLLFDWQAYGLIGTRETPGPLL
jgi:hypothetical protein